MVPHQVIAMRMEVSVDLQLDTNSQVGVRSLRRQAA